MNEEEAREIIDNMSEQELNNFIFFALQEVEKENQKLKGELLQKDKIIDEIEYLCIRKGDDESEEYGGVIIWNFAHKIMDIIKKGKYKMEIEVGDWIRSKDGFIGKVRRITYDNMEKSNYYICEKDNVMASNYLENIAKHSKIISEIVEVGDYVNGKEVKQITMFEGFPDYPKLIFTDKKYLIPGETIENKGIKTIVTHEQFENIEYKVEEE